MMASLTALYFSVVWMVKYRLSMQRSQYGLERSYLFFQAPLRQVGLCLLPEVCAAEGPQGLGTVGQKCGEEVQDRQKFRRPLTRLALGVPLLHRGQLEERRARER